MIEILSNDSRHKEDAKPLRKEGINNVLQAEWNRGLATEEYEKAKETLGGLSDFMSWRRAEKASPFPQFYRLFEGAALAMKADATREERAEMIDSLIMRGRGLTPRVRDLYFNLISELEGSSYAPEFEMTQRQLESLKDSGDLSLLQNPDIPWETKLNRMKTRVEEELKGRKALDRLDKERQEGEASERQRVDQDTPPPATDESKPSMDEMERLKEGETAPAIWTISPARGGYFKEQSFDVWDAKRNVWKRSRNDFEKFNVYGVKDPYDIDDVVIIAKLPKRQLTRLPLPYNYRVTKIDTEDKANYLLSGIQILKDANSDISINSPYGEAGIKLCISNSTLGRGNRLSENPPSEYLNIPAKLSEETQKKIAEINRTRIGNVSKARALASFTMRHLKYSNDSSYNALYENFSDGYFAAIDQFRKADCDVANTYFAALCSKLKIPVRHVVGHLVKGKDADGNSRVTSGTGHAWSEVWDEVNNEWVMIDATPPGDPQMEEDQRGVEDMPGDYGEQEAIGPTEDELREFEQKLKDYTEQLSYTREERELSEATGVELREARKIVKEINEAENTRLPGGERVVDVIAKMWDLIRESRKRKIQEYTGPLRKSEGGQEISDIIRHKIGIASNEIDPASRQKEAEVIQVEQIIREMQVRLIGDKSGSMNQTVDGETKWKIQRRAMYLVFSSLHRAEQNMRTAAHRMAEPLKISSQGISFRGSGEHDIDEDKPLSTRFSLEDKVRLWKSLGNQGSGNGDVPALQLVRDQIIEERKELDASGKKDGALRVVIVSSDGEPDNPNGVHQLAEELGKMNSVVVGIGMTETAAKVPIIFDTPHSRGDIARDINDLPAIIAKHVVTEAVRLFPEKTMKQYQKSIEKILAKFNNVGAANAR